MAKDKCPTPQEIETTDDLDIPSDPPPVEAETVLQDAAAKPMPQPEPQRSGCAKMPTKPGHIPSMTGSKCSYVVTQLESLGVLHSDAHMFVQNDFCQSDPDAAAMVMTQPSLKAGLKEWGDSAWDAAHNEMKQLHFRDTFKPLHWRKLSHAQCQTVLESHMFLKEKRDGRKKGRTIAGRKKQRGCIREEDAVARPPFRWSQLCSPVLLMQRKEGMSPSETCPMLSHRRVSKMRRTWPSSRSEASSSTHLLTLLRTCAKRASQRTRKVWLSC
jgi:hypothetical protein